MDSLIESEKCNKDNISNILKYFENNEENNMIESFDTLFKNLEKIFNKEKSFYKLTSTICKNEYLK